MTDLEEAFDRARALQPPALWADVERRSQVAHRPTGIDLESTRSSFGQRFAAAAVAFVVFGGAVALGMGAFDRGTPIIGDVTPPRDAITFTFTTEGGQEGYPSARMSMGDVTVDGQPLSFTWQEDGGSSIVDVVAPDLTSATSVPAGAPIVVEGNADAVRGWVTNCCDDSLPPPRLHELDLSGGAAVPSDPVPGEGADYVLEFSARWAQGTVTFLFPIQIVSPEQPRDIAPELGGPEHALTFDIAAPTAGQEWPTAHITTGSTEMTIGPRDMAGWGQPQVFHPTIYELTSPIAPGTQLLVAGSPGWVLGTVHAFVPGDAEREVLLPIWVDDLERSSDLLAGGATLPVEPGRYRLVLTATWQDQGEAVFSLGFEVEEGSQTVEPTDPGSITRGTLEGSSWQLDILDGGAAPGLDHPVTLMFGTERLGGSNGCNSYGGRWDLLDGRIEIEGGLAQTAVVCGGDAATVESRVMQILSGSPSVGNGAVDELRLTSLEADGVLVFTRIDAPGTGGEEDSLDCMPAERLSYERTRDFIHLPALPSYIRANVEGITAQDELVMVSGSSVVEEGSTWQLRRDGLVKGVVNVPELDGVGCRYSGIGGV